MSGPQAYLALAAEAERSGDWLGAYDAATRGLEAFPDDVALRHRAVLALARSGATERARERFGAFGLEAQPDEEIAALGARIAKDWALAATGEQRAARARVAAERYAAVYASTGGHYPAINAATMFLLAADRGRATELARAAVAACDRARPAGGLDAYWIAATRIEAALVDADDEAAAALVAGARPLAGAEHGALGTTLRQLELVCAERGVDPAVLAPLRPPRVVCWNGGPEPGDVALDDVGYGFGSLAAGADIVFAEALLERGAELHVVLPLSEPAFVAASVGDAWAPRFRRCLERARSVRVVGDGPPDDVLYRYGAQVAMGLALLRARHLHTDARRLTAGGLVPIERPSDDAREPKNRTVRALVFGDVKGYSKLGEAQVPVFVERVMGAFGRVLDEGGDDVLLRNSWGDGLYIVLSSATAAARCALALQEAMRAIDLGGLGLPAHVSLRVAAHLGPVHVLWDAVTRTTTFCGTHVTQAARIEPITPEGEVYVTEPFAAVLALESDRFACDYVGTVPTAKGYGALRMHVLRAP